MAAHHIDKIAPVHMHSPSSSSTEMQQFTVGKLDAGMAILLGSRASLIEFPSLLLPQDVTAGSVVEISVKRNSDQERRNQRDFDDLQRNILDTYGRVGPIAPELKLRALTQTSVVLEWSHLELATSKLLSLDIYRNGMRLAPIPNPMHNTSTKLSGLEVGAEYAFHLLLKTTAGVLTSNTIRTRTHTMTDTSGISVCFGAIDGGSAVTDDDPDAQPLSQLEAVTRDLLTQMGAKWSHKLQIDTTHYVCTSPRLRPTSANASRPVNGGGEGPVYRKALALNIPVVRPEWIVACHEAKRMVPISSYYLDQDPPNHASVQKLLSGSNERSSKESQKQQPQPQPQQPGAEAGLSSDNARDPTSRTVRARSETPPPPAPKDDPPAVPAAAIPTTTPAEEPVIESNATLGDSSVIIKEDEGAGSGDGTMEEIDLFGGNGKEGTIAPESGHSTEHYTTADAHTADVEKSATTDGESSRKTAADDNADHDGDNDDDDEAGEEVDLS